MKLFKGKRVMEFVDKDQLDICLKAGWSQTDKIAEAKLKAADKIIKEAEAKEVEEAIAEAEAKAKAGDAEDADAKADADAQATDAASDDDKKPKKFKRK